MPSALVGGHTVLMESGVSTQFSNTLYLLHPESEKTYCIEKANLQSRGGVYMRNLFRNGHVVPDSGTILRLNPGAALADLILHDPESAPAPDDLYFDDLDGGALKSLCEMLEINSAEEGYRVRYRDAHTSFLSMHA